MKRILFLIIIVLAFVSCRQREMVIEIPESKIIVGMYDTMAASVFKIQTQSKYLTYYFNQFSGIEEGNSTQAKIEEKSIEIRTSSHVNTGTALLIQQFGEHFLYLTCAHIVNQADSLYTFYPMQAGQSKPDIYSLTFLYDQSIFIKGMQGNDNAKLLAYDEKNDLALVYVNSRNIPQTNACSYPAIEEVHLGQRAYVYGYPGGRPMITSGMITPQDTNLNYHLINVAYNEGYSGAAVWLPDNHDKFRFTGLVSTVETRPLNFLAPKYQGYENRYNPLIPYSDKSYVNIYNEKQDGITHMVKASVISKFILANQQTLMDYGFNVESISIITTP